MLQYTATGLLVGLAYSLHHLSLGDTEAGHTQRIEDDLVLLDHTADGGHLSDIRQRLELIAQEPVLQAAQLRQVMAAVAIDQRILINPAHPGGVRAQYRLGCRR
ncbi:hypothetical protein D3C76_478980 [compost metagenome]